MKELWREWEYFFRVVVGLIGIIFACVLGVIDLHKRAGRWPWEKR